MPRFTVLPTDEAFTSAEIVAPDAARVLGIVERFDCKEANVLRDGEYSFSIRLSDNGLWCVFQRTFVAGAAASFLEQPLATHPPE